ncbi:unnamed protein product, partial [marine sediment metagenome]
HSAFAEIRAKLPYHRIRVIELINDTHFLENNARYLEELQEHWADVLVATGLSPQEPDFSKMRAYLENVKKDVDDWSADKFNQQMQDKCETLARTLDEQVQSVTTVVSAILNEKSKLVNGIRSFEKRVNEILSDKDIRKLDEIAATNNQQALVGFRQLPTLLDVSKQKLANVVLSAGLATASTVAGNSSTDFGIDTWFEEFNAKKDQLDTQISQLRAAEDALVVFKETRKTLARQSSIEADYYLALRDYAVR